jgi:uncharacterized membrane protein
MGWHWWYTFRSYVRSSLWAVPFIALLLQQATLHAAIALEQKIKWIPAWPLSPAGTEAALQAITSLTVSFVVFTFGFLLVAIQVASGQLTPRIIATTLLRDNVIRVTVGLFIFALLFAIGATSRSGSNVPSLLTWAAAVLGFCSIASFLYMIDHSARLLRPVSIVWRLAEEARAVIESVYPRTLGDLEDAGLGADWRQPGVSFRAIDHQGTSAIILAVNVEALVSEANRADLVVEVVPRVGDFVAVGEPLFLLHGGGNPVDEYKLRGAVAFGPERTIEQDATFAFRIIVDIAIKALSPAINDPTSAVLAIDQLHRLLRIVGSRNLHDKQCLDREGRVRLLFRMPNWENFVQLSCREIRCYGADNLQIARRLRAMLEHLLQNLPELRHPALRLELALLDRTIEVAYRLQEDRFLARIPDRQGLGGVSSEY